MADATDVFLAAAEARGRRVLRSKPLASAAVFDRATSRVTVELRNGCAYVFPARLVEDPHGAGDDDLAEIVVDGAGLNLHWPRLDVDLYVPALVSGILGTRAWMARGRARLSGQAKSLANGIKVSRARKARVA